MAKKKRRNVRRPRASPREVAFMRLCLRSVEAAERGAIAVERLTEAVKTMVGGDQ